MPFVYKFCHQAPPFFQREIYIQSYFAPCKNALKTNYVDHWVKAYCSLRSEIKLSPPDKVNLLLTNRGSTVASNATFVPRSSIVFISFFPNDTWSFFKTQCGRRFLSKWVASRAKEQLLIRFGSSQAVTLVPPHTFHQHSTSALPKTTASFRQKQEVALSLIIQTTTQRKTASVRRSAVLHQHTTLSRQKNNKAEYLLSIQCQCKTAENVCHCLWLARSQRTPHVLR